MKKQVCEGCKHYHNLHGHKGECRLRPPVLLVHAGDITSEWPEVYPNDWCGEFAVPEYQYRGD